MPLIIIMWSFPHKQKDRAAQMGKGMDSCILATLEGFSELVRVTSYYMTHYRDEWFNKTGTDNVIVCCQRYWGHSEHELSK